MSSRCVFPPAGRPGQGGRRALGGDLAGRRSEARRPRPDTLLRAPAHWSEQTVSRGPTPRPEPARSWGARGCAFSFGGRGGPSVVSAFLCVGKISAAAECYLNSFCSCFPPEVGRNWKLMEIPGAIGRARRARRGRAPPGPRARREPLGRPGEACAAGSAGSRLGGAALAPDARSLPGSRTGTTPPHHHTHPPSPGFGPPHAVRPRSGPRLRGERTSLAVHGRPARRPPALRKNSLMAPRFVHPQPTGHLRARSPGPPDPRAQRGGLQPQSPEPLSKAQAAGAAKRTLVAHLRGK